jgi:imidazolonepropionase-like amidohydrolase
MLRATEEGSRRCGRAVPARRHERGTIEVGKLADLIVVGGNPLEDIQNVRKLRLVLKEGAVVSDKRG